MKRKITVIVAAMGLLVAISAVLAMAYSGPSISSDPSKDYSVVTRPASETPMTSNTSTMPADTSKIDATSPEAQGTIAANAPGKSGNTPAALNRNTQGEANGKEKVVTTKKSDSMLQGLVDVISHMQL